MEHSIQKREVELTLTSLFAPFWSSPLAFGVISFYDYRKKRTFLQPFNEYFAQHSQLFCSADVIVVPLQSPPRRDKSELLMKAVYLKTPSLKVLQMCVTEITQVSTPAHDCLWSWQTARMHSCCYSVCRRASRCTSSVTAAPILTTQSWVFEKTKPQIIS